MHRKAHCRNRKEAKSGVTVTVNVNVEKIVRQLCITGVLIVGIIFGVAAYKAFLEKEGKGTNFCE